MRGYKHLLQCRCVLPQFKNQADPPRHQFIVFSAIKDDDTPVVKYAQCNNCGIIHKVVDICKSEVLAGKEAMGSIMKVEDIKVAMHPNLVDILERHACDLPTWEHAQFILENKQWGDFVVLNQEEESGTRQGKYVRIMGESLFKVENYVREEVLSPKA